MTFKKIYGKHSKEQWNTTKRESFLLCSIVFCNVFLTFLALQVEGVTPAKPHLYAPPNAKNNVKRKE